MAIDVTPEQRELGKANFQRVADGLTRRDFMKSLALTAGTVVPVSAAAYYGYSSWGETNKPVRTALIGAGGEGGVLVSEHNPRFVEIVAVCDIRPSSLKRVFHGERRLKHHYGNDAAKKIKVFEDYRQLLEDREIEAVIIALPLHLHAPVAIDAMKAGKHAVTEVPAAYTIDGCWELVETAERISAAGMACPIVSCGGTGSLPFAAAQPGVTELQAAGIIFMDAFYRHQCQISDFRYALTILTTVVSRPAPDRAIIDAGRKAMNIEIGVPLVIGREDVTVERLSAEHGSLKLGPTAQDLKIGDRLEFIPGYGDLTTVLHNHFYVLQNGRLIDIWPLTARGRLT